MLGYSRILEGDVSFPYEQKLWGDPTCLARTISLMPAKSGGSHAFSSAVSVVLTLVLAGYIDTHSEAVAGITECVGLFVTEMLGIPMPEEVAGMLVVIAAISFVWGIVYHYARHGVSVSIRNPFFGAPRCSISPQTVTTETSLSEPLPETGSHTQR